jgi:NAD(P)-dependent dehydrogenase (short-subunit alcohol dehydrogenase family)
MIRATRMGRPGHPGDPVIVTGSGTGLGRETALGLAAGGLRVFATIRNPDQRSELEQAARDRGVTLRVLSLDLTDSAGIREAVDTVVGEAGGVFGLVNNGGVGLRGCLEDCTEQEIREVFEANVLGTIDVTKAVLPHMRAAGCGRIVTVSSIGGRVPGFGVTTYCASKFAQEGIGEGLALELAPFGIQSVIVEPGMINTTRWSRHRGTAAAAEDPASPYHGLFWASEAAADKIVERSPTRPGDVAGAILEALTAETPRLRYVVGRGASVVIALRRYLPQGAFERLYYGGQLRRLERSAGMSGDSRAPSAEVPARGGP